MRYSFTELHDGTSSALELYIGDPDLAPQAALISLNIIGSALANSELDLKRSSKLISLDSTIP